MAQLKFAGIQPVSFNDRDCMPKLDTSKRLRLERIKFTTDAESAEADKVLASCFPDDEDFVLDFLSNKMTTADKQILRSYLLQGEKAIAMLDRSADKFAEETVKEALRATKEASNE